VGFDPSKLPSYSSLVVAFASLASSITLGVTAILVALRNNPIRADNLRVEQDALAGELGARWAILNAIFLTFTKNGKFRDQSPYLRGALLYALEYAFACLDANCRLSSEESAAREAYEAWREYHWGDEASPLRDSDLEAAIQIVANLRERTSQATEKLAPRTKAAFWKGYHPAFSMLMDELQRRNEFFSKRQPNPPTK
jgi:hypothetical protein